MRIIAYIFLVLLSLVGASFLWDSFAVDKLFHCSDSCGPIDFDGGSEIACGWLKDRWGVFWQVTPTRLLELIKDPDRNRARRAMEAMTKMIKINIAMVEHAADGA